MAAAAAADAVVVSTSQLIAFHKQRGANCLLPCSDNQICFRLPGTSTVADNDAGDDDADADAVHCYSQSDIKDV